MRTWQFLVLIVLMMSDLNWNPPGGTVDAGVGFWGGNWGLDGGNGVGMPVEVQVDVPGVVGHRVWVKGYGGRKRSQNLSDGDDADGVRQLLRHWRDRGLYMCPTGCICSTVCFKTKKSLFNL